MIQPVHTWVAICLYCSTLACAFGTNTHKYNWETRICVCSCCIFSVCTLCASVSLVILMLYAFLPRHRRLKRQRARVRSAHLIMMRQRRLSQLHPQNLKRNRRRASLAHFLHVYYSQSLTLSPSKTQSHTSLFVTRCYFTCRVATSSFLLFKFGNYPCIRHFVQW